MSLGCVIAILDTGSPLFMLGSGNCRVVSTAMLVCVINVHSSRLECTFSLSDCLAKNTFVFCLTHRVCRYYALGFFASRDNVWTTLKGVNQSGCLRDHVCTEFNTHADNAVAFLAGGPYGASDKVGFTNRGVVLYASRSDGVLLRYVTHFVGVHVTHAGEPIRNKQKMAFTRGTLHSSFAAIFTHCWNGMKQNFSSLQVLLTVDRAGSHLHRGTPIAVVGCQRMGSP